MNSLPFYVLILIIVVFSSCSSDKQDEKFENVNMSFYGDCEKEKIFIANYLITLEQSVKDLTVNWNSTKSDEIKFGRYIRDWNRKAKEINSHYYELNFKCFPNDEIKRATTLFVQIGAAYAFDNPKDKQIFHKKFSENIKAAKTELNHSKKEDILNIKVNIPNSIFSSTEINKTRLFRMFADKYSDGNISYKIGIYDITWDHCNWISGELIVKIFNRNSKLIKTHKRKFDSAYNQEDCIQKQNYINIYLGKAISNAYYIDAEYKASNGFSYFHKYLELDQY